MLGIWFNHEDIEVRDEKHDNLEILKQFGVTDLYILIKGVKNTIINDPETFSRAEWLFREASRLGLYTHGYFICSSDWNYTSKHPKKTDVNLFGIRKRGMINHLDEDYRNYLTESILTAAELFPMNGIQLDYLRFRNIVNGWSPDEESVYASYGVNVEKLKNEIDLLYDFHKPDKNLSSLLKRFDEEDPQLIALSLARRSILRDFTSCITQKLRRMLPEKELSITMMPSGLDPAEYGLAMLYYGQDYSDFYPLADHLIPMTYAVNFEETTEWVGRIAKEAAKQTPGSIIGLECYEPQAGHELSSELRILRGQMQTGIALFRYGRMILALWDGEDTLLYNSYPGTVSRLILKDNTKEFSMNCSLKEASVLRIKGLWDHIRCFGSYTDGSGEYYEGELCLVHSEDMKKALQENSSR